MTARLRLITACGVLALMVAGCGDEGSPAAEVVALGFGQEIARLDSDLAGLLNRLPEATLLDRRHAATLWQRARRTEAELRERLADTAPAGLALRRAAEHTTLAAQQIARAAFGGAPAPPPTELAAATEQLAAAADELEPRLGPAASGALARMRETPGVAA